MDIKEVKEKWKNRVKKALFLLFLSTPALFFALHSLLGLYFGKPIFELYIDLIFTLIFSMISFIGTIIMMIYLSDLIDEKYECMLEIEKNTKDMTLSDKILLAIMLFMIITPIIIIFFIDYIPINPEAKTLLSIILLIFLVDIFYTIYKSVLHGCK